MRARRLLAALVGLLLAAALLDRVYPPDLSRAEHLSSELRDESGRVINLRAASDGAFRLAATEGEVGPDIVPLLLAREDRRFAAMPGVDPLALLRAPGQLFRYGHIVSGGSTLAMQVARLLEPHPRTLLGKLHDIARAMQLQAHLGRTGILRLYLTLAPMGGNIEGVRAASLVYFGCEPASLSRQQAALLVGLPQSPARRRPDRHADAAWRAAARVLAAAGDRPELVPTPLAKPPGLKLARHLAAHFSGRTDTTVLAGLQADLEALAARETPMLGNQADMAALVVRNRDHAVLAWLGGSRGVGPGSMVDMVQAVRSPGSTLKPFIYAAAFDQGLITANTVLDDGPLRLASYAPRDFDRVEHGSVSAAEALRQSLNRPAVRLLSRLGPASLLAALTRAGARVRLPRGGAPSAALALGGAGVSLFDLAGLYADLADGGSIAALHVAAGAPPKPAAALISRDAASMVATILRAQPAPPGVTAAPGHIVAYKTGTSYGFRDAWAAGFTPLYTVVVWVGRPDGTSRPGASGRDAAAPLLFRIFALLPAEPPIAAPPGQPRAADLAPALARMTRRPALRIMFPAGAVDLAFDPAAPIDLRAAGGSPPYRWLADGIPLKAGPSGTVWTPPEPGFVHLTVTDHDGRSASTDVRLIGE